MTAERAGVPVALPTSERARALLAWLALHPGRQARTAVAAALWPGVEAARARANLRTALWALPPVWRGPDGPVRITRADLTLVDVATDTDELPADRPPPELLPELDDDWVFRARAELTDRWAGLLAERADRAENDGAVAAAARWTRWLTELRPLDEAAHRLLVERLLRAGERAEAVLTARAFADRLHAELGVRPAPATRAVHARARAGHRVGRRVPIFGRAAELTWLWQRWREAADGDGQVVLLTGEAGIGKSTLLAELARRIADQGGRAATAAAIDVAGETPFAGWLELARTLTAGVRRAPVAAPWPAELNRLSPGLGARLGHPEPPQPIGAPELERLRVVEALLRLVEWVCAERPTLLALDDAHRADRASLGLAAQLGRRLPELPALLLLVRRDGVRRPDLDALLADLSGHGTPVHTLTVPPIGDAEIAALVRASHDLAADRVAEVVETAEGNPLLAVEAARALVAGGSGPPPNLRAAVAGTLGRLTPPTRELVELLAVAGRPLRPAELRRLGVPAGPEAVGGSEGLLVRRDGRLGFRHELLRAAAAAELADPADLSDRLAEAIEPAEHVERAAAPAEGPAARPTADLLETGPGP